MNKLDDYTILHNEIEKVRIEMAIHGLDYEYFDSWKVAGRVVGVCDSKEKLEAIIRDLKKLLPRFEQYYDPKVF